MVSDGSVLTGLFFHDGKHHPVLGPDRRSAPDLQIFQVAESQLAEYLSGTENPPAELKLESAAFDAAARHMVLAEVLPPMLVLLTLTICFVLVRKKQHRARLRMDAFEDEHASEQDTDPESST